MMFILAIQTEAQKARRVHPQEAGGVFLELQKWVPLVILPNRIPQM
jgi:hypothetical protein